MTPTHPQRRLGPRRWLTHVLVHTVTLVGLVAAAFLVVVAALGRLPSGGEWTVLWLSAVAAAVCATVWVPTRRLLSALADRVLYGGRGSPDEAPRVFGSRLTRARSQDELRLQVEELRASRARVLAAADAERRRIERDLHDGAQQHLVALAVKLQLARQLADSDPAAAKALLEEIGRDVREALEGVRELAQGIYPPLLLDRGLAEALRAAGSEAGIPTRVEATGLDRYPPEVEATVYFCCVEALRSAAEHAGAEARATVRARQEHGALLFEVVCDGGGLEQGAKRPVAGLTDMSDRLGALDGRLTVSSEPGRGTCVFGRIPLAP